jgi:acetoin utilization protein AcuC
LKLIEVHTDDYRNWVFDTSHPTQGRRFIKAHERLHDLAAGQGVDVKTIESDYLPDHRVMRLAHSERYIAEVLDGYSDEWSGQNEDLGTLAHRMCGGTQLALDALLSERSVYLTAVHFPGAKHHAQFSHSSGFCVFADFAIAAIRATNLGLRVAILDIDAHHGDGTENLTYSNQSILTYSIHDGNIFPGTGHYSVPSQHVYNSALEAEAGDSQLHEEVKKFVNLARDFNADLIMIAMGADGLRNDPLSTLTYSIDGLTRAVAFVRSEFPEHPILLGGAGGYQPDTETPEVWAQMAIAVTTG